MRNAFFFLVLITLTLSCASAQQQPIPIEITPSIVVHSPTPGQNIGTKRLIVSWEVLDIDDAQVLTALIKVDDRFVQGYGPGEVDGRMNFSHPVARRGEHQLIIIVSLSDGSLLQATVPFKSSGYHSAANNIENIMANSTDIDVPANAHTLGDADAPITVVVFEELHCPFCARHHPDLLKLQEQYGRDKIRLVSMSYVVHGEKARYWHRVMYAFGRQGLYWEFLDAYYQNQREWRYVDPSDAWENVIIPFAREHGTELEQLKIDIEDESIAEQIDEEGNIARRSKVRGVPTTFINGHSIRGARGLEIMQQVIDRLLASP